jgi:preprotein translocase subunit SecA
MEAIDRAFERRAERLLGEQGQIKRDVENALSRLDGKVERADLLQILLQVPQGTRTAFDRKTHRRVFERTTRLTYLYYVAHLLESQEPEAITADVLEHLEEAQAAMLQAWGKAEFNRLSAATMKEMDNETQRGLQHALGEGSFAALADQPLQELPEEQLEQVINELGRQALTAIYRQLILGVVTELWVEYLTQMEALRVSIGLEAYAQRDPLVQYKNRAYQLFQNLLSDMRMGVVTRMFTYRPRDLSRVQTNLTRGEAAEPEPGNGDGRTQETAEVADVAVATAPTAQQAEKPTGNKTPAPSSKKRRRRRR